MCIRDSSNTDRCVSFEEFLREEAKTMVADRMRYWLKNEAAAVAPQEENLGEMAQCLSEAQLAHAELKFQELDKHNKGVVRLKELSSKAMFRSLGLLMTRSDFNKRLRVAFAAFDFDEDQILDFKEFTHMYNFLYLSQLDMADLT
eukprot:TRINITY_DN12708_c0_g1_i3.p2 TRINITY_DN12708_c0_g1~~TRINITY_DN12708_c0_g1_i3.p2  ORF type:complete len:145 (+),score=54.19 TRINITY_DN12708_c0_g1_i3:103-537(+)